MIRKIKTIIRNLWDYQSFIYNNQWWDWVYILKIIKLKLEVDIKYYRKHSWSIPVIRDEQIRKMKCIVSLIDRILKDEYYENIDELPESAYDWSVHEETGIVGFKDSDEQREKMLNNNKIADRWMQKDIENVFEYLGKNLREFWD